MTDKFKAAIDSWQNAMDERQFKVALKGAIDTFLQAESDGDELESRAALGRIHLATSELIFGQLSNSRSPQSCSFCGRSGSEVRLGAGPDVFICADCVGIFYEEVGLKPVKPKGS